MNELTKISRNNSLQAVRFRQSMLKAQAQVQKVVDEHPELDAMDKISYQHFFSERHPGFGAHLYARQMLAPSGLIIFGKIYRCPHINFLQKGRLYVVSESGKQFYNAPCVLPSDVGTKRAAYIVEDVLWCTVCMTAKSGEENLEEIENEIWAKKYEDVGLIDSVQKLEQIGD